jgi:DNA-binding NarL/FixJ family response regulator
MARATILIADDHAIVAEGLANLLRPEFAVVGTAKDGPQLLAAAHRLRPDVIVTDLTMPGMNAIDTLHRLSADGLTCKVVVLTMHADAELAAEALRAGASAFIVKHAAGRELIAGIHAVLRGKTYVTPELAPDVLNTLADPQASTGGKLTPRQREVVRLLADGRTMKEVAATLGVSPRTVETHKYQMMATLGLRSTVELIRYAIEHGLATPRA